MRRAYLRAYRVFKVDQIEGLDPSFYRECETAEDLGMQPDAALEPYFGQLDATIDTSDDPRAYYHPGRDVIHMPPIATFHTAHGYYETLGHEACHWTGGEVSVRGGGGISAHRDGVSGVAIEVYGRGGVCRPPPVPEGTADDQDQHVAPGAA